MTFLFISLITLSNLYCFLINKCLSLCMFCISAKHTVSYLVCKHISTEEQSVVQSQALGCYILIQMISLFASVGSIYYDIVNGGPFINSSLFPIVVNLYSSNLKTLVKEGKYLYHRKKMNMYCIFLFQISSCIQYVHKKYSKT